MDSDLRRAARIVDGDVEEGAHHLRDRIRSGELSEERARLAARLGCPLAGHTTGVTPSVPSGGFLYDWVKRLLLEAENKEVSVRFALAACRLYEERGKRLTGYTSCLRATRAWLLDPSESHRHAARKEAVAVGYGAPSPSHAASTLARAAWAPGPLSAASKAAMAVAIVGKSFSLDEILLVLRSEVVPWLLGNSDLEPLAD